jgi:hypothetical protein
MSQYLASQKRVAADMEPFLAPWSHPSHISAICKGKRLEKTILTAKVEPSTPAKRPFTCPFASPKTGLATLFWLEVVLLQQMTSIRSSNMNF